MDTQLIALITIFGTFDPDVGIMKGILAKIAPEAGLIDLTHDIPPGDIQRGAFVLWQSSQELPKGTVILVVIDPGVGTDRKGIYLDCAGQRIIGPDNGIFSYLNYKNDFQAWELSNRDYQGISPGNTFHGRDIFAPAAAYAAAGIQGNQFGDKVQSLITLPKPGLYQKGNTLSGEILSMDKFGNLFTSIGKFRFSNGGILQMDSWIDDLRLEIDDLELGEIVINNSSFPLVKTFSIVPQGDCAGIIGSTGLLEIICYQGSAVKTLGLKVGDSVQFKY